MKSKWLVIAGIILITISLKFGAYFASIHIQIGELDLTLIDPDQNTPLIISAIVFFAVAGVLVKDFIYIVMLPRASDKKVYYLRCIS